VTHDAVDPPRALELVADDLAARGGAVLFLGRPGRGKSTLARELATRLQTSARGASLLAADPGQPTLGPPATIALERPFTLAFLGSTDPMAVRLTALGELLRLVREFRQAWPQGAIVVDACGLVANALGREWALRQAEATLATHAVLVERGAPGEGELEPLARLFALRPGIGLVRVRASVDATPGGPSARRARRGAELERWLSTARERTLPIESLPVLGVPERGVALDDWRDRLLGLLDGSGRTLTVGIARELKDGALAVRTPDFEGSVAALRVGDAAWDPSSRTVSRRPFAEPERPRAPGAFSIREKQKVEVPPFASPGNDRGESARSDARRAPGFQVHLANGLFGDPLVHLRPIRERDAILLDLGRASSLPTKILHRVGLVLLSHAHMDHFFGFDELLRALLGAPREVTIVGPEGTVDRIASRIAGYTWNLIELDAGYGGPQAPRFRVTEVRGDRARSVELVPGSPPRELGPVPLAAGIAHEGETFTVRAVPLEHRNIVSLAYLIAERPRLAVRPEAVAALGAAAGPWLDRLKHAVARGELGEPIEVAPGRALPAGELAREVLIEREGQRVAYVTDAAWTELNRKRIVELASGADLLICEATFVREDEDRARATAHLPAFAAAEIARDANVGRLLPFHLSPRYEEEPERIFRDLLAVFPRIQVPREVARRLAQEPSAEEDEEDSTEGDET
jgi:ribonuclease BN (tRNA processing enzyme)/polynucleotide 5'-kinase involved in rRNA processing